MKGGGREIRDGEGRKERQGGEKGGRSEGLALPLNSCLRN